MEPTATELLLARLRRSGGIVNVHFKVSDHCNHTCVHCYEVQGEKGELSTDQARVVLDRLAKAGAFLLTIGGGEATLRRDLLELIAHARRLGFAVTLYTNAFTVTHEVATELARLSVWQVHVSLYAGEAALHDAITRVPGSFERTLRGIRELRSANVTVVLKTPVMRPNADQLESVTKLADQLGCSVMASAEVLAREDGDVGPAALNLDEEQHAAFLRGRPGFPSFTADSVARKRASAPCGLGAGGVVVQSNGEVRPCTMLPIALGNAFSDGGPVLIDEELYRFLGSITLETVHGCRDCDLAPGCARCHGTAALEAGDALGPYRSACAGALAMYKAANGSLEVVPDPALPARPRELGPFKIVGPAIVRQIADHVNERDDKIAAQHPWVRPSAEFVRSHLSAPSGEKLVQLRIRETGTLRKSAQPARELL